MLLSDIYKVSVETVVSGLLFYIVFSYKVESSVGEEGLIDSW